MSATRPTYQAIVDAALGMTDATSGWLLADDAAGLRVVATAGSAVSSFEPGQVVEARGARAYALASGQPTSLLPQPGDEENAYAGGFPGLPPAVLAVPCGDDEVVGVIEVAAKSDGTGFGFGDIEALSGLAHVASAGLLEQHDATVDVATPAQISGELRALAERNPARYRQVAQLIEALLSG